MRYLCLSNSSGYQMNSAHEVSGNLLFFSQNDLSSTWKPLPPELIDRDFDWWFWGVLECIE